jgi:hypothetical protein
MWAYILKLVHILEIGELNMKTAQFSKQYIYADTVSSLSRCKESLRNIPKFCLISP